VITDKNPPTDSFTVAVVVSTESAKDAVLGQFDVQYASVRASSAGHLLGCIGAHFVVVAHLGHHRSPTTSIGSVISTLQLSFLSLAHFALVGAACGVADAMPKLRLGDVVVGKSQGAVVGGRIPGSAPAWHLVDPSG
jgi:hypothetical protein